MDLPMEELLGKAGDSLPTLAGLFVHCNIEELRKLMLCYGDEYNIIYGKQEVVYELYVLTNALYGILYVLVAYPECACTFCITF